MLDLDFNNLLFQSICHTIKKKKNGRNWCLSGKNEAGLLNTKCGPYAWEEDCDLVFWCQKAMQGMSRLPQEVSYLLKCVLVAENGSKSYNLPFQPFSRSRFELQTRHNPLFAASESSWSSRQMSSILE